jgi:hypothetical protein
MVNYVKDVESLIDFHPEVNSTLLNGRATLDVSALIGRLQEAKQKVSDAEVLELHRMELIRQRFGTVDAWLAFQEEQRILKASQAQEYERVMLARREQMAAKERASKNKNERLERLKY